MTASFVVVGMRSRQDVDFYGYSTLNVRHHHRLRRGRLWWWWSFAPVVMMTTALCGLLSPPSSFNSSPYIIIFWSNKKKATIETRTRKATRVVAALPWLTSSFQIWPHHKKKEARDRRRQTCQYPRSVLVRLCYITYNRWDCYKSPHIIGLKRFHRKMTWA